jgi:hypothetical protein
VAKKGAGSSSSTGRIKLEGGPRLRATLKSAAGKLEDLAALNKRVADLVADEARRTAPVGPPAVHVRDTIRTSGTKTAAIVRAGNNKKGPRGVAYAMAVHWGYQSRPDRDGAREVVKARPWISQAAQDLAPRWTALYVDQLQTIVDSVEGTTTP